MTEPLPLPPEPAPIVAEAEASRADGRLVIDLTQLVPPLPQDCATPEPDPFNAEIVVCKAAAPSPRLGPMIGPQDDGFGSAIPRARIKLTDKASAEANLIKQGVGGFDAEGAEVRLKLDF